MARVWLIPKQRRQGASRAREVLELFQRERRLPRQDLQALTALARGEGYYHVPEAPVRVDLGRGFPETVTLTSSPLNQMASYLKDRYGREGILLLVQLMDPNPGAPGRE